MKHSALTRYAVAISATILLASCSQRSAPNPTGKWRGEAGVQIKFLESGSFVITNLPPEKIFHATTEFHGTWHMIDSTQIEMVMYFPNGGSNSTIYGVSVSGDTMTMTQPGFSGVKTFQRTKD